MRCQLHMDNRERIANDSKNNNVTNATETFFFFFFFALGNFLYGSAFILKEILLVTINGESQENHHYLNGVHVVTLSCDYSAAKLFCD